MTDVLLQQTQDGGEISFDALGNLNLTETPETSVYLSLFGGGNWWADIDEPDSNLKLTGEFGQLVKTIPPSSSNLIKVEQAALRDLQWLINVGAASSIAVSAMLAPNNILEITINLEYNGRQVDLIYSLNWTA